MNTASSLDRVEKLGPRTRDTMAVLWPERVKARVSVSGYLVTNLAANKKHLRQRLRMPVPVYVGKTSHDWGEACRNA